MGLLAILLSLSISLPEAFAEPTVTITVNDCSRFPEFLEVSYRVSGFPPGIGAVVFLEIGDEERIVGGGIPFTDTNGEGGGGFLTTADAPGPYILTVYEDNDSDLVPDEGGAQASTSFTCGVIPPDCQDGEILKDGDCVPIESAFRNLAECLSFVVENPESGITDEDCIDVFGAPNDSIDINNNIAENKID